MKQKPTPHRRALGLLLAATALPFSPLYAQDVTPAPAQPPVVDVAPPPVAEAPPPAPDATPPPLLQATPAPTAVAPPPAPEVIPAPEPAATSRTTTTRTTTTARRPAPTQTRTATRTTTTVAPAPIPVPVTAAPVTAPIAATPPATEILPAPVEEVAPAAPVEDQSPANALWPWLIGALALIGIAAALMMRRRRRAEQVYYEEMTEPEVVAAPTAIVPESFAAAAAVAPAAAIAPEAGRPELALEMRPRRAGVNDDDAVVEFELTVGNRGTAAARDVRVSTWMFPAGHASEAAVEAEHALIEPSSGTIGSGEARKMERSVALSTDRISADAVLPVVVAEAHYRLPDGTEAQTTASFEVGVSIDGELAHFDVDNPSGLHDDVVARPHLESVDA